MTYIPGDPWKVCDVCGFEYRSSETRRRWDNLIVCESDFETRHPQDFVRGRKDRQNIPDPRPEAPDRFLGPLSTTTTAAANPGATSLAVESTARFEAGDDIGIISGGETLRRVVDTVASSVSLTLTVALDASVSSGALVINYDAVAEADIG
jgi:hypothetical protein